MNALDLPLDNAYGCSTLRNIALRQPWLTQSEIIEAALELRVPEMSTKEQMDDAESAAFDDGKRDGTDEERERQEYRADKLCDAIEAVIDMDDVPQEVRDELAHALKEYRDA